MMKDIRFKININGNYSTLFVVARRDLHCAQFEYISNKYADFQIYYKLAQFNEIILGGKRHEKDIVNKGSHFISHTWIVWCELKGI